MNNRKVIIFEGIDGSGKSLISKLVAEKVGAQHLETPLDEFKSTRKYVDQHTPVIGQLLFYLSTNIDLSKRFSELKEESEVVCARYYYSSLIDFSTRMGLSVERIMERLSISDKDFYQPDLTILLHVNKEEQRKRLDIRNNGINKASDRLCLIDNAYREEIENKYFSISTKKSWKIIDTSSMTIPEVLHTSLSYIEELK